MNNYSETTLAYDDIDGSIYSYHPHMRLSDPLELQEMPQDSQANVRTDDATDVGINVASIVPVACMVQLTPILPPEGCEKLNWRPAILKSRVLISLALVNAFVAGSIVALVRGAGEDLQISLTNENVHILSTYLPAFIATITILILQAMVSEVIRLMPFCAMADGITAITRGATTAQSVGGQFFPWLMLWKGRWNSQSHLYNSLRFILAILSWLTATKVMLLDSNSVAPGSWTVIVNEHAAIYLIIAYSLIVCVYLGVLMWLSTRITGLRFDPASLQDQVTLFAETHATVLLEYLPASRKSAIDALPSGLRWRIGYWHKKLFYSDHTSVESTVYGICAVNLSGKTTVFMFQHSDPAGSDHSQDLCGCSKFPYCRHGPRRLCMRWQWAPLFFHCFYGLIFVAGLIGCFIALANGTFKNGFKILDNWKDLGLHFKWIIVGGQLIRDDNNSYSIVFRFLPTFIAGMATGHIRWLDTNVRFIQPFISMSEAAAPSPDAFGVEYLTMLAFKIPLEAFNRGHYKVAWFSTVNAVSSVIPIAVAGLFKIQKQDEYMVITITKISYFITLFMCLLFTITSIWAWPREADRLPRLMLSLADTMSLFRGSKIIQEKTLDIADPKTTRKKFQARMFLLENKYRLGFYPGTCGSEHFGVDVVETSAERVGWMLDLVNVVRPVPGRPLIDLKRITLRRRRKVRHQVVAQEEVDQAKEV